MDWKECCGRRIIKEIQPDVPLITSLQKSSANKLQSAEALPLSDITAASKFSLAYDALREILEALASRYGFKVYNHECYTAFLKEILKNSELGEEFDFVRKERNAINYEGKDLSPQEAEILIQKATSIRKKAITLLSR